MIPAALLLLSYMSMFVNPAKVWLMNIMGLLFIPLSIINLVLCIYAATKKSKAFIIPLISLLPCVFLVGRYIQISDNRKAHELSEKNIKIVTYNVGRFASADNIKSCTECIDSVFSYLSTIDADVICLQEFFSSQRQDVAKYINKYLPKYYSTYYLFTSKYGVFGNVTLSRYPVLNKGKILFEDSKNLAIYTDFSKNGKDFRVYNCHLESYAISLSSLTQVLRGNKDVYNKTETKMRRSITRRPIQVDQILRHIENCSKPSFVCGDFNDNPISNNYFRIKKGRKDTFLCAGYGFGASYRALWPMLRIDYIFCPDSFKPCLHLTPKIKYSDHYPVIAELSY